jgi:hypothetical protein
MSDADAIREILANNPTAPGIRLVIVKTNDAVKYIGAVAGQQEAGALATVAGIAHGRISKAVLNGDPRAFYLILP